MYRASKKVVDIYGQSFDSCGLATHLKNGCLTHKRLWFSVVINNQLFYFT